MYADEGSEKWEGGGHFGISPRDPRFLRMFFFSLPPLSVPESL